MKRKINCETARNFSVEKALEKLGHFPKKTTEKEAWFLSPFRSETQASFKVSRIKNRWYDHGEGVGGNVIDLVCRILKCSIGEALEFLNDGVVKNTLRPKLTFNGNDTGLGIVNVQEITHPALIQYLNTRNIPISIAKTFCKEVWYQYKGNRFFAIGLQNYQAGWELRNKIFKNSSSPKSYTYLKNNNKQVIILEGMFDLLSLATLNETEIKASDIIVLNSIAFIKAIENYLVNYESVLLYLDCDNAGKQATTYLIENYKHVIDQSSVYEKYKDLNNLLCHER
ncbi:MAG: toprim domain-containing protein [Lutibacter sp.]